MSWLEKNRLLGGILIISGTTLGAGMLAFPTVTAFSGFLPSALVFLLVWGVMLGSSFCFLDVNLSLEGKTNMISMAEKTLGIWGKVLAWVVYLLLLYSLTAAYIAGGTPLFVEAFTMVTGFSIPTWLSPCILPALFGGFIYSGTRSVDFLNRLLMIGLVAVYFFLVFFVPGQVDVQRLSYINWPAIFLSIPIIGTAFGYHIVIPSLSTYLDRDRKKLSKAILIGSSVPVFIYLLWQTLVLGAVPFEDLFIAYKKGATASYPLAQALKKPFIAVTAKLFAFFAIVTSFVGVVMSLTDFLMDGFKLKQSSLGRMLAVILAFFPPVFFVFTYQRGFYTALQYAGAFVPILLIFLPAAMAWKLKKYRSFGKKLFLVVLILVAFGVVTLEILLESEKLNFLIVDR